PKNTSQSMLKTKLRQIENLEKENASLSKQLADLSKKLADKNKDLYRYSTKLQQEEDRERKMMIDAEKKREREQLEHQRRLTQELELQRNIVNQLNGSTNQEIKDFQAKAYDFFISHASDDKDEFVRPLAEELNKMGLEVWYDEFTLKVGDSLRRSIDQGLAAARFGIVVLSSSFFKKNWTQYELDGLVAREIQGNKIILPIWHKISKSELMSYSPSLADKVALNSSLLSIEEIAKELSEVVGD
ncbi:toll/interleukin-1 receptor domain-containing protein, partial [Oceanobacillus caeni]